LAPFRDTGVMLHGKFFEKGLSYEAGVFRNDGEKNDANTALDEESSGDRTFAGRVTGAPLRLLPIPAIFKNVQLGVAVTETHVPEGLNSLRAHTVSDVDFFKHVYINGQRSRVGSELSWMPGPFSVQGEFIHVSEERKGQSIRGGDLPDKISRGWYLTGTWVLTGEKKQGGVEPRHPFLTEGFGAIEVAGRYEQLRLGSAEHLGNPSAGPRSSNLSANSDRVWTIGLNWYLNHYAKIQVNGIREKIEDVNRSPIPGQSVFKMVFVRLQFSM
jgi:phosphate-selective porin OprO/OprP